MTAAAPFVRRHVGLSETDLRAMLSRIGVPSLETLIAESVPASIRLGRALDLPPAASEQEALSELFAMMVAEKAMQQYRGTNFEKPLLSAFRKVTEGLTDTISFNLDDFDSRISF